MAEKTLQGIAASDGIAIGRAFRFLPVELNVPDEQAGMLAEEFARFVTARQKAEAELQTIKKKILARTGNEEEAAIFDAHILMLHDPTLESTIKRYLGKGINVEQALVKATDEIAEMLASMSDEMFAARALDVRDVGQRLLRILLGLPDASLTALSEPAIVVAQELTPSDTASLDPKLVLGLCTVGGGWTSHTAILARTLGIPAIVGLGPQLLEQVRDGDSLILDGALGNLIVDPLVETCERYQQVREKRQIWLQQIRLAASQSACTADGCRIEVAANIGDIESAKEAIRFGAEGVGLLRTEFIYLKETTPPSEEKQINAYRAIFDAFAEKPIIVRTLDIGGDKPPTYLDFTEEMNPFLGWRAIRICLDDLPLFKTQLRAILRAGVGHKVMIMFPMISGLEELRRAKDVLAEVKIDLKREGLDYLQNVPVGIMVETPAAVALADKLIHECDFFSLGTNDLTQYALAVDRTNMRVAKLFQPLHPAVLRLIQQTIDAAHQVGKWVGMCGELAGMMKAIPILIGLGLDELSMTPHSIPEAKWLIAQITTQLAHQIAQNALQLDTAAEVEALMQQVLLDYRKDISID